MEANGPELTSGEGRRAWSFRFVKMKLKLVLCIRLTWALFITIIGVTFPSDVKAWDYIVEDFKEFHIGESSICYSPSEALRELFNTTQAINTDLIQVGIYQLGNINGVEIVEAKSLSIEPEFLERYRFSNRWEVAQGRSVLMFKNATGSLCPFYDAPVSPFSLFYSNPAIVEVEETYLVRIAMKFSGTGAYLNLDHFTIRDGEPVYLDHRPALDQVREELRQSHNLKFHRGEDIQGSQYSISIAEDGACGACASGRIFINLGVENSEFVVRSWYVNLGEQAI